jgi:hypothetical protein
VTANHSKRRSMRHYGSPESRWHAFANKGSRAACWIWSGNVDRPGYGRLSVHGRVTLAHRFGFELWRGTIPVGLEIDHLCRNTRCVNPWHLDPVTPRINRLRQNEHGNRGGIHQAAKTHCVNGHQFTAATTYLYRGKRHCITCRVTRLRRYRAEARGNN